MALFYLSFYRVIIFTFLSKTRAGSYHDLHILLFKKNRFLSVLICLIFSVLSTIGNLTENINQHFYYKRIFSKRRSVRFKRSETLINFHGTF